MVTLGIIIYKNEKQLKMQTITTIQGLLESMAFDIHEIHFINKHLTIALNDMQNKIAIIENFNPKNPTYYSYKEIMLSFIEKRKTLRKDFSKEITTGSFGGMILPGAELSQKLWDMYHSRLPLTKCQ